MAWIEITMTELVWPGKQTEAGAHFERVVARILERDLTIKTPPEAKVCKECGFQPYCLREGTIVEEDWDQ